MGAQFEQKAEYQFHASTDTRQILNRLNSSTSRMLGQNSFVLEELLASLSRDQYVLQLLVEELNKYRGEDIPSELLLNVKNKCLQFAVECDVIGVNSALSCGATEKAFLLIKKLSQKELAIAPKELKPFLFNIFVSVAWLSRDWSTTESLLQIAKRMDTIDHFTVYLDDLRLLLQARSELYTGKSAAAIRICQTIDHKIKPDSQIKFLALEIQADAFGRIGDMAREQKVLEDWENNLVRKYPNGPCDWAASSDAMQSSVGISGESRSDEILQHYSRLAFIYEQKKETRGYAKGIYTKFMNTAYHQWIDTTIKQAGTITERLARLNSSQIVKEQPDDFQKNIGITIIEPERMFGRVSEKVLENLIENLTTASTSSFYAVTVGQVDMKERHFSFQENLGQPSEQLFNEIPQIFKERNRNSSIFDLQKTSVLWKGQMMEWILFTHAEDDAPDIKPLTFGLRADPVSNKMDIAVYVLYVYSPPLRLDSKKVLTELLCRKLEDLQGYKALERLVVDLVKRAARRLEQKACDFSNPLNPKGPIRL